MHYAHDGQNLFWFRRFIKLKDSLYAEQNPNFGCATTPLVEHWSRFPVWINESDLKMTVATQISEMQKQAYGLDLI